MGILSLKGYTQNIELYLWLFLGLFTVLVMLKNVDSTMWMFIQLLIIGLFWGILNGMVQSAFYEMYVANNVRAAAGFSKLPQNMSPRMVILLIIGPMTGAATGFAMGVLSIVARKVIRMFF